MLIGKQLCVAQVEATRLGAIIPQKKKTGAERFIGAISNAISNVGFTILIEAAIEATLSVGFFFKVRRNGAMSEKANERKKNSKLEMHRLTDTGSS